MKKILCSILLILALAFPVHSEELLIARMNAYVLGAGTPVAVCGELLAMPETIDASLGLGQTSGTICQGQSFTVPAGGQTINSAIVKLRMYGTGQAHTYTFAICENNAGEPSTTCTNFDSAIIHSDVPASMTSIQLRLNAGKYVTEGTWWIRAVANQAADTTNYLKWGYYAVTGNQKIMSDDNNGVGYTTADADATGGFSLSSCVVP